MFFLGSILAAALSVKVVLAGDVGRSCADLKETQEKFLTKKPQSCVLAQKLHEDYASDSSKFLEKCLVVKAMAGKKLSREEDLRQRAALQAFLSPPSLDPVVDQDGQKLGKACSDELRPLLQYRYQAQKIVGAVGRSLRE